MVFSAARQLSFTCEAGWTALASGGGEMALDGDSDERNAAYRQALADQACEIVRAIALAPNCPCDLSTLFTEAVAVADAQAMGVQAAVESFAADAQCSRLPC